MALISIDDIKEKAPDRKAFATAKKIAVPSSWSTLGRHGAILWGNAIGSSGDGYAVYVDTAANSLQCSCPSRKRPCKHALAILIMDAEGTAIPDAEPPSGHKWDAEERYQSTWE